MNVSDYLKLLSPIAIYIAVSITFLCKLKQLNLYLIKHYSNKDAITLIGHNDYQPLEYFGLAVLLVVVGGFLIYFFARYLRNSCSELGETICMLLSISIAIVLMLLIIRDINIPIFQAILSVLLFGGVLSALLSRTG